MIRNNYPALQFNRTRSKPSATTITRMVKLLARQSTMIFSASRRSEIFPLAHMINHDGNYRKLLGKMLAERNDRTLHF